MSVGLRLNHGSTPIPEKKSETLPDFALSSAVTKEEWAALRSERDPELLMAGLESLADRLYSQGYLSPAVEIWKWASTQPHVPPQIQRRLQGKLDLLQGEGSLGARVEMHLGSLVKQSTDAGVIGAMLGASVVGQLGRAISLGRLLQAPAGILTRGLGARLTAGLLGFGAEGLAFAGFGRAMAPHSGESFGADLARSYVGLGALKFSGWLGRQFVSQLGNSNAMFSIFLQHGTQAAVPQVSMFFGLMLAHKLETKWDLRPETSSDRLVVDTLAAMISLQVGTKLGHAALGRNYHRFQQELALSAQEGASQFPWDKLLSLSRGTGSRVWATPEGYGFFGISLSEGGEIKGAKRQPKAEPEKSTTIPPSVQIAEFGGHYNRIFKRLESVFGRLSEQEGRHYLDALDQINQRRGFWEKQSEILSKIEGEERERFQQDIGIGFGLLRERLLRVGAEIYQEPLEAEKKSRWGLRFRPEAETKEKTEPTDATAPNPSSHQVPALVNRDVGYGKYLSLREHQVAALHALRGRLRLLQSILETDELAPPEALAGTIVMPVGGGKTRTMVAGFAAALELGFMEPKSGDKVMILNHTDQIHGQNLKVAELLSSYFKRKSGRLLKISEYKAERKDLSGDVVVVSIPSISEASKRELFQAQLKQSLGQRGKVAMVAVDEVHHLGLGQGKTQETWAQAIQSIRDISPHLFQVGFTATPTGKEPGRLFTVRERELMQARVTPRTYLVKIDGIDLSQLKVTSAGEFESRSLQSTLLGHPERNQRIYEALNQHGMRSEFKSPSGQAKLEPTLGFGQDLKHAQAMAEDYVRYFAKSAGDLGNRKLAILGKNRGKISAAELKQALADYREGKVDGVVALVSGITAGQKDPVLQAVANEEIEAVFTVDALAEGADLYMFSHQIGGRPTFSRFKKGQERGRTNRRGPDEVTKDGKLLKDPPKILFDVVDRYLGESPLIRYGDILGVGGHTQLKNGEMLDALSGRQVSEVDRSGKDLPSTEGNPFLPPKPARLKPEVADRLWGPMINLLEGILAEGYQGDVESLALDLGETEAFVEGLLAGQGWENNRWFLKRLASLLYQERESFLTIYNEARDLHDAKVASEDYALLQGALALYARWENRNTDLEGFQWKGPEEALEFSPKTLAHLRNKTLSERVWRQLWRGLGLYLEGKATEREFSERELARERGDEFERYLFQRSGWPFGAKDPREILLFEARRAVARVFGGVLPRDPGLGLPVQKENSALTRWLSEGKLIYSKAIIPLSFYAQVRKLLVGAWVEEGLVEELIEAAIFRERGWDAAASDPSGALLLEGRRAVARVFGGVLPNDPGLDLPKQIENSPLTRWLRGEPLKFGTSITPQSLYAQVRKLLVGAGMKEGAIEELIEAAIFSERGWDAAASDPQGSLLLEGRRAVARIFGGVLPQRPGLDLPMQNQNSPLTRWLRGEKTDLDSNMLPQVRSLLIQAGGLDPARVDILLQQGKITRTDKW